MPTREELEQLVERKRLETAVLAKRAAANKEPETSVGEAAIYGAAQGATMGFSDEVTAGVTAARDFLKGEEFGKSYERNLNETRQKYAKAQRDQPAAYRIADIGGTIATSALIPALAPVKGATVAANAARAAVGGAISGAGYSDAKNLADLAADTAVGGAVGGVLGGLIDKGGKVLESLKPANLNKVANERSVKAAIGQNQKLFEQMRNVRAPDTGEVALESAGRRLRESGILTPLAKAEGMEAGVKAAKEAAGQKISLTLKTLDDALPNSVSGEKIAQELTSLANSLPDSRMSATAKKMILDEAEILTQKGDISFAEAQQFKNLWKFDPKLPERASLGKEMVNKVNRIISKNMDETAEQIAEAAGKDSPIDLLVREYKKNRGDYQAFKFIETGIKKNVPRNISNRFTSPSDYLTGAIGLGYGLTQGESPSLGNAAPYALAAAALNHQIRLRGNSFAASTASKLANILEKTPEAVGRFSNTLLKAAEISPNALWITHQFLLKDPEYQATIGVNPGPQSALVPRE